MSKYLILLLCNTSLFATSSTRIIKGTIPVAVTGQQFHFILSNPSSAQQTIVIRIWASGQMGLSDWGAGSENASGTVTCASTLSCKTPTALIDPGKGYNFSLHTSRIGSNDVFSGVYYEIEVTGDSAGYLTGMITSAQTGGFSYTVPIAGGHAF